MQNYFQIGPGNHEKTSFEVLPFGCISNLSLAWNECVSNFSIGAPKHYSYESLSLWLNGFGGDGSAGSKEMTDGQTPGDGNDIIPKAHPDLRSDVLK